jgi:hypothetical protein
LEPLVEEVIHNAWNDSSVHEPCQGKLECDRQILCRVSNVSLVLSQVPDDKLEQVIDDNDHDSDDERDYPQLVLKRYRST